MSEPTSRPTLIKPPPTLPHHSPIENTLSLLPLSDIGPDIFTNARPLWHPPGARGIFGGAAIAQCLSAAQFTVPGDLYTVHSMHCYFVLAGNSEIPILYHVERVRDGRSFITRTVQARQRGKCIFTTTISFMRTGAGGKLTVEHQRRMPADIPPSPPDGDQTAPINDDEQPFEAVRCPPSHSSSSSSSNSNSSSSSSLVSGPESKMLRQWIRARGQISACPPPVRTEEVQSNARAYKPGDNHQAHLSALAYMSDSYFIGTVARVHNLTRFSMPQNITRILAQFRGSSEEREKMKTYLEKIAHEEKIEIEEAGLQQQRKSDGNSKRIGMMVSLDHSIYFHNPRDFRADEWMMSETESPWAGDGRGLVVQRIWSRTGTLIATCVQEGLVRLQQEKEIKL